MGGRASGQIAIPVDVVEELADEAAGFVPACASVPEAWFTTGDAELRRICERVCGGCPMRGACLAGAIARDEQAGIWGGRRFGHRLVSARLVQARGRWRAEIENPEGRIVHAYAASRGAVMARLADLIAQSRRQLRARAYVRAHGRQVAGGPFWVGSWDSDGVTSAHAFLTHLLDEESTDAAAVPVAQPPAELEPADRIAA